MRWLLLVPALLAGCFHWIEVDEPLKLLSQALCLGALAFLGRDRRALWLWAWVGHQWLAGIPLNQGAAPFLYLALLRPPARFVYRLLTLLGALIASHAVVSFLAFRLAGGFHGWRPEVKDPWLQALVWPYYCGHYPRGAHAIGFFLNDNLLGLWCVAMLCLSLEVPGRLRLLCVPPLLLAVGWSYSRSAYLALAGACGSLAIRKNRYLLLVPTLIPLLFLPFATGLDRWRFSSDWTSTLVGRAERLHQFLAEGSFWGGGPVGLVDSQWLKTGLEQGWSGLLIQLGFCFSVVRRARPGVQAALLALLLGGVGCDLWDSPHLAATFMLLCACSFQDNPASLGGTSDNQMASVPVDAGGY